MRPLYATVALVLVQSSSAHAQVSGTVIDQVSRLPIEGAVVSVQASDIETQTDVTGAFALPDAAGADLVVVAGAKGYFYTSSVVSAPGTGVALELEPVPREDDDSYTFRAPLDCANCHDAQYDEWNGSPMAKAGTNTWVYDIYDGTGTAGGEGGFVYTRDSVHATENPESECSSCHQPESWVQDAFSGLGDLANPTAGIRHGVACDLCHRIADIDASRPNFPGLYPGTVTLTRPADNAWTVMYGLLGDADFVDGDRMRASYQPQLRAEVCAACHQDKNDPDGDGDFEEDDGVISEPTYLEWLASDYSNPESAHYATCVDCHMPGTTRTAACDDLFDVLARPEGDVRSHLILGTTPEYLENAVTLTLDAAQDDDEIIVDVVIDNDLTGHHVPTGVTIRNMILVVEAWRDGDGAILESLGDQVVHDLGGVGDPAEGYYAGLPGKLYGKLNHDADGNGPTFFTDATGLQFDNRIHALESDATQYRFRAPADGGQIHVRARVIYRRSWRALVDAKQWTLDGHGNPLADVAAPHFGHLMEDAERVLDVPSVPSPDAGTDDDDGGGCGCRVGSRRAAPTPWLALFALVVFRRSRYAASDS